MRKTSIVFLTATLLFSKSYGQLHVATSGTKNVLLEVSAGAWAGFVPDAFQDIQEKVLPMYPNTIIAAWHNGDPMQVTGDPFCTGSGYISAFPSATIDRAVIGSGVEQMRPWETGVGAQAALSPNFDVDMVSTYNPVTRVIDVYVTGTALSSLTGNWNINAYAIEDSISSAPTAYNQHNYYGSTSFTSCTGSASWYNSGGNPISPAGLFSHNYVVTAVLCPGGSVWGEAAFTNPTTGTSVTKHYSYTVPSGSNPLHMSIVGMVEKNGTSTSDRMIENAVSSQASLMPAGSSAITADSFTVYNNQLCAGTEFYVTIPSYHAGVSIYTEYGDGSSDTHSILAMGATGYADFTHAYATSGSYTVKQIMYNGSAAVDSVTFTNTYHLCNVLPISFYLDGNSNCVQDAGEPDLYLGTVTRVDSNGVPVDTISATSGFYYTAYGTAGDVYTFTVITPATGLAVTCPSGGAISDTLGSGIAMAPLKSFAENCTGTTTFDLREFVTVRAGIHSFRASVIVDNTYCPLTPATLTMELSPKYSYWSSTPAPASVSGTTVTWNFAGLTSTTAPSLVEVHAETPGPIYAYGDTVNSYFLLTPTSGDANPTDNVDMRVDSVRAGYDPNLMQVTPEGHIAAGTQLEYAIQFENDGNDTAFNIYVMDTLSDNVDISTLKLQVSSAKMMVSKLTGGGHNILKFDFPNINLLDSTHHGLNIGTVVFKINAKAGLPVGTLINNRAGIHFDNNPVVMTNSVTNIVGNPSKVPGVNTTGLSVYPNPVRDELVIQMEPGSFTSFTVTNAMGAEVMQQDISAAQTRAAVSQLPAGVYYITLKGDNGNVIRKFVKM